MRELRERAGPIAQDFCLILAALVVCQLAGIVIRWNPFRGVTVPELPSLTAAHQQPCGRHTQDQSGGGHGQRHNGATRTNASRVGRRATNLHPTADYRRRTNTNAAAVAQTPIRMAGRTDAGRRSGTNLAIERANQCQRQRDDIQPRPRPSEYHATKVRGATGNGTRRHEFRCRPCLRPTKERMLCLPPPRLEPMPPLRSPKKHQLARPARNGRE